MKLKIGILAVGALVLATATVSAAIMPAIPTNRASVTQQTTWSDLKVDSVAFPANLDIKTEGVFVLKTQDQWNAFWATVPGVTDGSLKVGDIPQPDFSHQFGVVASYGWKSEGYAISVTHAKYNGQQVYVQVDRQVPNPANCRVYFDPFFGGVAIVEAPHAANFATTPVGSAYHQVMEAQWVTNTHAANARNCNAGSA